MTLQELHSKYTKEQLSSFPGDTQLRYELFSPVLQNLFENKVVYHERFTSIVKLENIVITPERFKATAVPYLEIERKSIRPIRFPSKPWEFGCVWGWMRLINNSLCGTYAGWSIWTDPETVKQAEQFTLNRDFKSALDITYYQDLSFK